MFELGKFLVLAGGIIVVLGLVLVFTGKFNLLFGRLPGDFIYRGKSTTVYFPLATSLILSVILSLIFWLIGRGRH
ncbi:MAG TPA: DUF2905 domain-containing protein [Candidatus Angelobacter sp.]